MNRAWKTTPDYSIPSVFKTGVDNSTPNVANTDLDNPIPLVNGTINDDGSNQLTGSNGGDNTTANVTYYKEGGGQTDVTAQNLIANNTSVTKTWTIANLAAAGTVMTAAEPFALWLRIEDATELAKFKTSGTCLEIRFRTNGDAANKYYELTKEVSDLAVLWNWVNSGTTAVNALTQGAGGAPSGALNEFVIQITTNNATDTFTTDNVVYDLLRQWATADLTQTFVTGYPSFDYTDYEVTVKCFLSSTQANGFDINGFGLFNTDGTVLMHSEDTFTSESKSSTDEFSIQVRDRIV